MLTFVETKLRRGRSVVELVGHSVLKFAWKYATKDQYSRAINFNVLPGGTARALWLHIKSIALKRAHAGIRVTFGIMFLQNSIRVMTTAQLKELLTEIRHFFIVDLKGYHRWFFINIIRAPELLDEGYGKRIEGFNRYLEFENKGNKFGIPCDPGRTLEKTKAGPRVIIKDGPTCTKWRPDGYHPSDKSMPAFSRYVRTWVDANTCKLENKLYMGR